MQWNFRNPTIVGNEKMLDYQGVGLRRFHYTAYFSGFVYLLVINNNKYSSYVVNKVTSKQAYTITLDLVKSLGPRFCDYLVYIEHPL